MSDAGARKRGVFLDRDGTICEEMGYINHISRFQMFPFVPVAIRRLNQAGLAVIVVTNQSGVARGIFPESLVHLIHEKMAAELAAAGARVDGIYFCPHKPEDACDCRKPRPGMLERAAREHSLDLAGSYLVGDRNMDLEMARQVGARGILVLTGYGRGEYELHRDEWLVQPYRVAENLDVAVDLILEELRAGKTE